MKRPDEQYLIEIFEAPKYKNYYKIFVDQFW